MLDAIAASAQGDLAEGRRCVVVAAHKALTRHGLDRLLHVLGWHGAVYLESTASSLKRRLEEAPGALVICDRTLLHELSIPEIVATGTRLVLVDAGDFLDADLDLQGMPLCALLSEGADEKTTLAQLQRLLDCDRKAGCTLVCQQCELRTTLCSQVLPLSRRELHVFDCIGRGLGPTQIAEHCGLSVKTIEGYREKIKHKLQLEGRDAIARTAMRWRQGYRIVIPDN